MTANASARNTSVTHRIGKSRSPSQPDAAMPLECAALDVSAGTTLHADA